jgi:hypothetical protein
MKSNLIVLARSKASQRAKTRLVDKYRDEYNLFYREECQKIGLKNNLNKEEKIAALQKLIKQLQEEGA